jgi:hypothetical protein
LEIEIEPDFEIQSLEKPSVALCEVDGCNNKAGKSRRKCDKHSRKNPKKK